MATFSTGSEADGALENYCFKCIHWNKKNHDIEGCPIFSLHQVFDYAAPDSSDMRTALNLLWPVNSDGENGDCALFVAKETVDA